jgi:hypothetical protein
MNLNSCFNTLDYCDPYYGVSKVCKIDPKEFPFSVEHKNFKTRAEAENYAKRRSGEINDDVIISQRVAIVKFPIPDLKVEDLVVS